MRVANDVRLWPSVLAFALDITRVLHLLIYTGLSQSARTRIITYICINLMNIRS